MENEIVEIGDKVRDPISGLIGIVVSLTEFLTGCKRCSVQREGLTKDGKPYETCHFDCPQLEIISKKKIPQKPTRKGGPREVISLKSAVPQR